MASKTITKATAKKMAEKLCRELVPGSIDVDSTHVELWLETADGRENDREVVEVLADRLADAFDAKGWTSNGRCWRVRFAGKSVPMGDGGFSDPMHY